MTVRMATCSELSEDRAAISRLAKHYWDIEKNSPPLSVLFPWLPSFARKAKKKATKALYTMLLSYVNVRRKTSTESMEPIDFFISLGLSDNMIVGVSSSCDISIYMLMLQQTIIGIIFVGVVNTGVNCQWFVSVSYGAHKNV